MALSDSLGNNRNYGNPLHFGDKRMARVSAASPFKLELFLLYLHLSRVAWYLFSMASILSGLFKSVASLPPICECILSPGEVLHYKSTFSR